MNIVHFCAGLDPWNGMANTARQFVAEELAQGHASRLTNDLRLIAAGGFDRLHIHGTWLPRLWKAAAIARRLGAEVVVRPSGNYDPLRIRQGVLKRVKKWLVGPMERAMLRRADVVQATCEAEAGWIRGYCPSARIELTDLKRFFRLEVPGTEAKGRRILFLGRVDDPLKGVDYLRRASDGFEVHYVSDKTGAALASEWEWCDVLCLPTLSENFGRVIAEALERGKRVVTTDGAPAWADYFAAHPERGVYIRGFREGTDDFRVRSLRDALTGILV